MPTPPLPDNPSIRVHIGWTQADGLKGGNRLYFNYAGGAPTGAQCLALATWVGGSGMPDILASFITTDWSMTEVDVVDITTRTGLSGTWTGSEAGTRGGTNLPAQCASGIEFGTDLRYRGGKPRIYLPPGATSDLLNPSTWESAYVTGLASTFETFITDLIAQGLTAGGDLTHVYLSYYDGYATTTPPWRGPGFKYPPKYRDTAVSTDVLSYIGKAEIASQKRRRVATTF